MAERSQKSLSGFLGPVSPRRARARLAARGGRAVRRDGRDHARRPGAGGDHRARARAARHRDVCIASYHDYKTQGGLQGAKTIADAGGEARAGAKMLVVDDLVDTGATAKVVREMLPKAHFATVYAKPLGRPLVDTFITEVSQDTWIYFPWDMGLAFQPPIAKDAAG